MKKLFLLLSALVIAGLCLSCSKPASNGSGTTGGSTTGEDAGDGDTIVDWEACYLFDTTADMLNYFDMKLEYIDIPSGEVKEVIMTPTATRFAKKAKVTPPLSLGLKLTTTLKTGVSIEDIKAVATIQYVAPTLNYTIIITRKNGAKQTLGGVWPLFSTDVPTPENKSGEWVAGRYPDHLNKYSKRNYDAEGNDTSVSWD